MPSDVVTIVVSTGIGVSVIAGVLSGVCYILAHGFTRKRSRRPLLQWHCAVCGTYLRSRLVERVQAVICLECEERVCKLRCAKKEYTKRGWICYNCLKQPSFLRGIISSIRHLRFNKQLIFKDHTIRTKQIMEKDAEAIRKREKDHIRDFIEKLVSTILGGNIDDASVFRIYSDKYYDTLFEKYHQDLKNAITDLSSALHISITNAPDVIEQSPSTAHTNLKRLIEKLLDEASYLPNLKRAVEQPSPSHENERTYEELLATAIVNKVVGKSQRKRTSSAASNSSRVSTSSNKDNNKEYFFGEETLDTKWNPTDFETTSNSSFDEYLQSDSSHGSTKYVDRVSLTIRQRIEEVTPTIEDEDVPFSDDSNWHLQKRQFQVTHSPVPVPMLVPNPVTTAKVLIGDKEAEETSDLSDAASEYDENEATGVHSYMLESKMIIGGKNIIDRIEDNNTSDEETSADSGVKEDRDDLSEKDNVNKPKADVSVDDENVEDVSLASINSNIERDSEYLEKYGSLPRTVVKSPSPLRSRQIMQDETLLKNPEKIEELDETPTILEGSYSKKEKEKWKNPIEMPNNPYSKENIEKRSRQIFGRDYFPKDASLPLRKKKEREEEEEHLYRAEPVAVQSIELDDNLQLLEITSDSDLSLINCYDVENSKVYQQSFDSNDEILITVNTTGLLCEEEKTSSSILQTIEIDERISPVNNEETFPRIKPNREEKPIIRKNYYPVVRSFALSDCGDFPIDNAETTDEKNKEHEISFDTNNNHTFSLEYSDNERREEDDIGDLKEKRLVASRLNKFSKSVPALSRLENGNKLYHEEESQSYDGKVTPEIFVSVKDLRKIFENNEVASYNDKPVHSLTARSLSKPMKEKLKNWQ